MSNSPNQVQLNANWAADVFNEYGLKGEVSPLTSLDKRLGDAGFECSKVLGDGNCLFRTLSHQLTGDESDHLRIRKEICRYLEDYAPVFMPFFPDEDNRSFREHLQAMKCPCVYGGQAELAAFANLYNRRLHIFHDVDTEPIIMEPFPVTLPSDGKAESASVPAIEPKGTFYLVFRSKYEHYDSTLPITEQSASPAQHNSDEESSASLATHSWDESDSNPACKTSKRTVSRNPTKIIKTTSCQGKGMIKSLLRENNNGLKKVRRILEKKGNIRLAAAKLSPQKSSSVTIASPVEVSTPLVAFTSDLSSVSCQVPSHGSSPAEASLSPAASKSDLKLAPCQGPNHGSSLTEASSSLTASKSDSNLAPCQSSSQVNPFSDSNTLSPQSLSPRIELNPVSLKSARRDDEESTCSKRVKTTGIN